MSRVAGVLLAAGASTRLGQPKQLLSWQNATMVAHAADTVLAAGLDPAIVILGCEAERVRAALGGRSILTAMNWRWQEGLSSSVKLGLSQLPPDTDAAVFLQCDQPLITAALLRQLVSTFERTQAPIVHPVYQGKRSTPVLFSRSLFPELAIVSGDEGGRSIIDRHADRAATLEVKDPDVLADVDTLEEYQRLSQIADARFQAIGSNLQSAISSLQHIRNLIVDMDGVLWRGNKPMDTLAGLFAFLRDNNIRFILATNNASQRPDQYVIKLGRFGVAVPQESILTSAQATAAYLATIAPPGTPVHALGMEGLRDALTERGFALVESGADYVVSGFAMDLTWQKLANAALQIQAGAAFIGTNPDVTFPSEVGLVPGNGSQLAALQAATGVAPLIIGKPEPWLYREAMQRMGATPESTAVIGDRLDTDIAGGVRVGITTILVLSGISTRSDLSASPIQPDLVCADIGEAVQVWEAALQMQDETRS